MGFGFLIFHMRNAATDGKLHGIGSIDIGNDTHTVFRQKIDVTSYRVRHGYIHRYVISKTKICYLILCYKTQPPNIIIINIGQYRFIEFLFFASKCFKKIFDSGIDEPDARCFFQSGIKKENSRSLIKKELK
jgi:hypothetical protein